MYMKYKFISTFNLEETCLRKCMYGNISAVIHQKHEVKIEVNLLVGVVSTS